MKTSRAAQRRGMVDGLQGLCNILSTAMQNDPAHGDVTGASHANYAAIPVGEGKTSGSPLTFLQAALFQWVNPKAWVITISAIATYTPGDGSLWPVLIVALVCGVVNFPTIGLWTMFGTLLRSMLTQPTFLRVFNISMAVLLVLSLAPLVWD